MMVRKIPLCHNCPYKPIDFRLGDVNEVNGKKINIFDIDLVIEIGKRIEAIVEVKRYCNAIAYNTFTVPAHEIIGYKKVAKSLKCDLYLLVFDGYWYYLAEIDRFSKYDVVNGVVKFPRSMFRVLTESELQMYFLDRYG